MGKLWVPAESLTHIHRAENSSNVLSCHVTMDQRFNLNPQLDPHGDTDHTVYVCVYKYVCVCSALSVSVENRSVGRSKELNGGSQGFIRSPC